MASNETYGNRTAGIETSEAGGGRLTAAEPYRSTRGLARVVTALLAAYVVVALLSAGSAYLQLGLLEKTAGDHTDIESIAGDDGPLTDAEVEANDRRQAVVGLLMVGVFLACVVAFLLWLHRSYSNLAALGNPREGLEYSPRWAVGGWFIPFANIVVPYRVVRETWARSDPAVRTRDDMQFAPPASSPLVLAWWLVWIVSNVIDNLSFRFAGDAETPAAYIFATKWAIFASALDIVSAALAVLVVNSVTRRQEARAAHVVYSPPGPPPPPSLNQMRSPAAPSGPTPA